MFPFSAADWQGKRIKMDSIAPLSVGRVQFGNSSGCNDTKRFEHRLSLEVLLRTKSASGWKGSMAIGGVDDRTVVKINRLLENTELILPA